ncbi:uncharacterized protein HaLaN_08994, partial [Haematococcus lacustris]
LFNDRAKKHYQPVMAAARVLDPVNFLPTRPRAQPLPPMKDLTPEEQEDVVHVVARLAEVSEAEARRELRRFESGTWHPEMTRVANDIMSMAEAAEKLVFIQTNDELATNSDNFDKYNGQNVAIQLF